MPAQEKGDQVHQDRADRRDVLDALSRGVSLQILLWIKHLRGGELRLPPLGRMEGQLRDVPDAHGGPSPDQRVFQPTREGGLERPPDSTEE